MATGTVISEAPNARAKASARRSSSGNADAPVDGVGDDGGALEPDYVVDRIVHRAPGCPACELAERGRVRLAAAELLEALVVRVHVRDEAHIGSRVRAGDHPPGKGEDRDRGVAADVEYPS